MRPQVLVHPPCPSPGSPRLRRPHYEPVFLVPLGSRTVGTPRGCQAWLLGTGSPRGAQGCPLGGDNSGHSSNLELFCPYQLVSAGLPHTRAQGGALSGCFPGQERAAAVQRGCLSNGERQASHGYTPPRREGTRARGPHPVSPSPGQRFSLVSHPMQHPCTRSAAQSPGLHTAQPSPTGTPFPSPP